MAFLMKVFLQIVIVTIVMKMPAATSAQNNHLGPLFERTMKDRLASVQNSLSIPCNDDFTLYRQQLEVGATWALNMFDSSGKPESGVLKGAHTFLGFYSQCIDALKRNVALRDTGSNSTVNPDFSSKYCLSTLRLTPGQEALEEVHPKRICRQLGGVDFTFAVCVPSTCNERDVGKIAALCKTIPNSFYVTYATSTFLDHEWNVEPFSEK